MNMNKPPDETLKQGQNRSWLLIKKKKIELRVIYNNISVEQLKNLENNKW